ncbi:phage tail family protein [bacterium]|nr:phage tail family protein [bacterium]
MIYTSINGSFDFEQYSITDVSGDDLPSLRNTKESVIGKQGQFTFTDGFNNKQKTFQFIAHDDVSITTRRNLAREMKKVLSLPGELLLSFDNLVIYKAQVLTGTKINFNGRWDTCSVTFDLSPIGFSSVNGDNFIWDLMPVSWSITPYPWDSYDFSFSLTTGDTITVNNYGNVESTPIIKLNGDNNVTFTHSNGESFTYTGLEDSVYLDIENLIVYNTSKENKLINFEGDFFKFDIGENVITITGTFTTLDIEFFKKDMFI